MGGQQTELYYSSLDQTVAAVELSPVCINSDSELEIHFNDVSSVAAAELSPELASSNNSSEVSYMIESTARYYASTTS